MSLQPRTAKKIVAIVKPELAPLMRMLGVEEVLEADEATAAELLRRAVEAEDVGLVITQKSLAERVPGNILEGVQSRLYPALVVVPDSAEDLKRSPMDSYRDMVRRFIGFELYVS